MPIVLTVDATNIIMLGALIMSGAFAIELLNGHIGRGENILFSNVGSPSWFIGGLINRLVQRRMAHEQRTEM